MQRLSRTAQRQQLSSFDVALDEVNTIASLQLVILVKPNAPGPISRHHGTLLPATRLMSIT
jgi:hypothetical protein